MIINGRDTTSSSSAEYEFNASKDNTYNDYFTAYWTEYRSNGKTKTEVYKEHLQTASKDKLVDIAIEGHSNYQWANNLAYERGLQIEYLTKENETLTEKYTNELSVYSNIAYNSKIACLITIIVCATAIGVFYIYQYIKYRLKKYADKIRSETIEEINKTH